MEEPNQLRRINTLIPIRETLRIIPMTAYSGPILKIEFQIVKHRASFAVTITEWAARTRPTTTKPGLIQIRPLRHLRRVARHPITEWPRERRTAFAEAVTSAPDSSAVVLSNAAAIRWESGRFPWAPQVYIPHTAVSPGSTDHPICNRPVTAELPIIRRDIENLASACEFASRRFSTSLNHPEASRNLGEGLLHYCSV